MSYQLLINTITWPIYNEPHSSLIHTLDDDSLLRVFSLYRPLILDESEADNNQFLDGGEWNRERWWFTLAHTCRKWRYLVLVSASHLRLSLVCARGTPVADMLAHSPPLPLIVDYFDQHSDITAADEQGIILALQHRDRVRRIRVMKPIPILQKLIMALDGEFPILEYLSIIHQRHRRPSIEHNTPLNLPEAFRAPHLCHLVLMSFAIPIGSPLLTTMGNLITLSLNSIPPSAYFHPNALLQRLSLMPQLEILGILFNSHFPSRNIERQLFRTPIVSRVTLPNLRWIGFQGASAYLELLLPWLTVPLLERLQVSFFNQLSYSIPHLQQFMGTAENLRLDTATLTFLLDHLTVMAYPHKGARMYTFVLAIGGRHLDWQVAFTAQVFRPLRAVFSTVQHLTVEYRRHLISSEWNNEADRTQWHELLGTFDSVKTVRVDDELVDQISLSLQPGEGESPTDLLPELQELSYSARGAENAFIPFVDARRKADRPVPVICHSAG